MKKRYSGILMPVFSLPSDYGIGDFGKSAYNFVDFLCRAGVKVWQMLPLTQTGYGNSPYSSVSASSFNPYFISPEILYNEGLLLKEELESLKGNRKYIDYGVLYSLRYPALKGAFNRFNKEDEEFKSFVLNGEYTDYALFMAIKIVNNYKPFYEWEDGLKNRDEKALKDFYENNKDLVLFYQFLQFKCVKQWESLKAYANGKGVELFGDMPLYMSEDSVDVWVNPKLFKLNKSLRPIKVAGVPPDYFCEDGQLWGNPVYDYENNKEGCIKFWTCRLKRALSVYDLVRIDHFRGLDRYYEVDAESENAKNGEWVKVPSKDLFDAIHKEVDKDKIIAEDLGLIDDSVRETLAYTGYPGMKVLSFAFDGSPDNLYLPEKLPENSVCYTGTHDNDTVMGLIEKANEWTYTRLTEGVNNSLKKFYIDKKAEDEKGIGEAFLELGYKSNSFLFIFPMQDVLMLDSTFRINEPGTVKESNWSITLKKEDFSEEVVRKLKYLGEKYNR